MTEPTHLTGRWRRGTVVAAVVSAAMAIGLGAAGALIGSAHAGVSAPEVDDSSPPYSPPVNSLIPPHTFGTVTPNLPIASDAPYEASTPTHTFVATETTDAAATTLDSSTTTTATSTETTATTDSAPTTLTADGPSQSSAGAAYSLVIDVAQVNCDGTIHLEYSTTADPTSVTLANHIVMFNPTSSPAAFTVVETSDNAAIGSFVFDGPGAPDLTYRIFVLGLFDPTDPDGPKVIDQANVAVVEGC